MRVRPGTFSYDLLSINLVLRLDDNGTIWLCFFIGFSPFGDDFWTGRPTLKRVVVALSVIVLQHYIVR